MPSRMLSRMFIGRQTNWRARVLVGLFLIALYCQCTQIVTTNHEAPPQTIVISGEQIDSTLSESVQHLLDLANQDHVALLEYCQRHIEANYRDFTCTLIKQERLGSRLDKEQTVEAKFMQKPYSVAMHWVKNAPIADRSIYVEGKWNNQMMVRPAGILAFAGPQMRKPDDKDVMKNTLRPINQFGFLCSLESLIEVYVQAKKKGDLACEIGLTGPDGQQSVFAEVAGRKTIVLIRTLPAREDYPAKRTEIYIDVDSLVPVLVRGYNWDDQLSSSYLFTDLKFNVGLTPDDFLPEANGMGE
jgi:hypothetical protein